MTVSDRDSELSDVDNTLDTLYCSFCGKSQHDVDVLVAGPTVFICNECVEICANIVRERREAKAKEGPP